MADNVVSVLVKYYSEGAKNTKQEAEGVKEAIEDFTGVTQKSVKIGELFKRVIDGVKKASATASGTLKQFTKSLGRILLYRSVRKILSETAQAFKEGTKNLYAYSVAMNNTDSTQASKNLDSLATSILYVKNCLGSILAPVIQMITPLVYQMSDAFASASRSISQVFSALTGNTTYTYATRFATEFDKKLSNSVKNAKAVKRTLLGFDEINRLDAPNENTDTSYTSQDYLGMFDKGKISEKATAIAKILKNVVLPVISTIGTALVGVFVGSKITSAVESFGTAFGLPKEVSNSWGRLLSTITLIVSGLALIVAGVYDVVKTGGSLKSWLMILSGIALVVTGVAISFGGIPALITGIVLVVGALGLFVVKNWETIKSKGEEVINDIKLRLNDLWQRILGIPVIGFIANILSHVIGAIVKIIVKIGEIDMKVREIMLALGKAFYTYVILPIRQKFQELNNWIYQNVVLKIIGFFQPIAISVGNFLGGIVKGVLNGVFTMLELGINGFISLLNGAINIINKIPNVNITKISKIYIPRFANGGFPAQGQLFIANEMGAEMVGSMNGRTTVANNQQIVEGIKQGVTEAMRSNGNQNITLNVDGKQLFNIMVDRNNSTVRTTGRSPLLV